MVRSLMFYRRAANSACSLPLVGEGIERRCPMNIRPDITLSSAHSRASGNPAQDSWIPAFAGMSGVRCSVSGHRLMLKPPARVDIQLVPVGSALSRLSPPYALVGADRVAPPPSWPGSSPAMTALRKEFVG